jgi:hypothetical protein
MKPALHQGSIVARQGLSPGDVGTRRPEQQTQDRQLEDDESNGGQLLEEHGHFLMLPGSIEGRVYEIKWATVKAAARILVSLAQDYGGPPESLSGRRLFFDHCSSRYFWTFLPMKPVKPFWGSHFGTGKIVR